MKLNGTENNINKSRHDNSFNQTYDDHRTDPSESVPGLDHRPSPASSDAIKLADTSLLFVYCKKYHLTTYGLYDSAYKN